MIFIVNSLVHVRDEKVSFYRYFQNFSSHDNAIYCTFSQPLMMLFLASI